MRAFIQSGPFHEPVTHGTRICEMYFTLKGYEVIPYTYESIMAGDLDAALREDDTILQGGVGTIRKALTRLGRPQPDILDIPSILRTFAGRSVWDTTMGEVRSLVENKPELLPIHIKPRDHQKLFTGTVIHAFRDLIKSAGVPPETPLLAQEVVTFVSEWRATILEGKILHVGHYKGDPLVFPDVETMEEGLNWFVGQAPVFCSMDWGITDKERTLLVECNDGFSLGNYGLGGYEYVTGIEARWHQLMGRQ